MSECAIERRSCEGRRWYDYNRSCAMMAYVVFTAYGLALGFLFGYMAAKFLG